MVRKMLLLAVLSILLVSCASVEPSASAPAIGEPQIPETEIPRVSLEDAKAAFDAGEALFADVRSLESWRGSHIPGAISLPVNEIESRLSELDPAKWIITYCT